MPVQSDAADSDTPNVTPEDRVKFDVTYAEDENAVAHRFVLSKDSRLRLDKFLQGRIKSISRNKVQNLIDLGGVLLNGSIPKASQKLREGDVVEVLMPPRPATYLKPQLIPLNVLYEDVDFIVINKQAGLIVHPARGELEGTLLNALAWHFAQGDAVKLDAAKQRTDLTVEGLSEVGAEHARPGVVHRLDRNTTGVILVAKRDETHWLIAKQFEQRTNLKAYLALVHGCPDPPAGAIEQPIGRHPTIREAMAVRHDSMGRDSLTLYRVRERYEGYSLVELELKSGRTHQIRVHLSYLGCPIVGDIIYGGEPLSTKEIENPPHPAAARPNVTFARTKEQGLALEAEIAARDDVLLAHPALHAALLAMHHPVSGQWMRFTAPLHSPFLDIVRLLRERLAEGKVVKEGWHVDLDEAVPDPEA